MSISEDKRIYEKKEYQQVKDRTAELTENSDNRKKPKKKNDTQSSTGESTENNYETKNELGNHGASIMTGILEDAINDYGNSRNNGDILGDFIHISKNKREENNSPKNQTNENNKIDNNTKIIFITNITPVEETTPVTKTTHSKFDKDNERLKICRMAMNSIYKYLNYRCQRKGLHLRKVNARKLFGSVRKQRWFLRRKIKYIFASKSANKKVIIKMIKTDVIFKKFVEYRFEDFYQKFFIKNYRYINLYRDIKIFLAHFHTFENCLSKEKQECLKTMINEKEIDDYMTQLRKVGEDFIKDIKGGGDLLSRCDKKRTKTKICIIKYKWK